jgi:DNA-binding YbaB/EbfC family protein
MLKQPQKTKQDMLRPQAELAEREYDAPAGGGAVRAVVNGAHQVKAVEIRPEVVDPEDVEMLQDLITAAVNEALKVADETAEAEMKKLTGGMNLPGLF